MCGRVIQKSRPGELSLAIVEGLEERDNRWSNVPPRYKRRAEPGLMDHPS